jgi:hypothetical protein
MSSPHPHPHFTEPTTNYWQRILHAPPSSSSSPSPYTPAPPYKLAYPAPLPDARILLLPIRPLATNAEHAVASLLVNHASLSVVAALGALLAEKVRELVERETRGGEEEVVLVGVPTLGLSVVLVVAEKLGHGMCVCVCCVLWFLFVGGELDWGVIMVEL